MMKLLLRTSALLLLNLAGTLLFSEERVEVQLDASEAKQALAILDKRKHAQPVTDADWQALFATQPYRRLKMREAAMHRDFSDDDFRKFILSDELAGHYDELERTL